MYRTIDERSVLAGVVSNGDECWRGRNSIGYYTKIQGKMAEWIKEKIEVHNTYLLRDMKVDFNRFCRDE